MGSGHKTTNRSAGRSSTWLHDVALAISLGCSVSRLLTRHNQRFAQWSPDPFPRERVGSGHETKIMVIVGFLDHLKVAVRLHASACATCGSLHTSNIFTS